MGVVDKLIMFYKNFIWNCVYKLLSVLSEASHLPILIQGKNFSATVKPVKLDGYQLHPQPLNFLLAILFSSPYCLPYHSCLCPSTYCANLSPSIRFKAHRISDNAAGEEKLANPTSPGACTTNYNFKVCTNLSECR